ncbi:hypothetical protein OAT84_02595, partial [Gammaproteobacteria bacterium]|nr:hypothetical protein [Gammaproteobacteria bacterium]
KLCTASPEELLKSANKGIQTELCNKDPEKYLKHASDQVKEVVLQELENKETNPNNVPLAPTLVSRDEPRAIKVTNLDAATKRLKKRFDRLPLIRYKISVFPEVLQGFKDSISDEVGRYITYYQSITDVDDAVKEEKKKSFSQSLSESTVDKQVDELIDVYKKFQNARVTVEDVDVNDIKEHLDAYLDLLKAKCKIFPEDSKQITERINKISEASELMQSHILETEAENPSSKPTITRDDSGFGEDEDNRGPTYRL